MFPVFRLVKVLVAYILSAQPHNGYLDYFRPTRSYGREHELRPWETKVIPVQASAGWDQPAHITSKTTNKRLIIELWDLKLIDITLIVNYIAKLSLSSSVRLIRVWKPLQTIPYLIRIHHGLVRICNIRYLIMQLYIAFQLISGWIRFAHVDSGRGCDRNLPSTGKKLSHSLSGLMTEHCNLYKNRYYREAIPLILK